MKIDELISELEKIKLEHGNVKIVVYNMRWDTYEIAKKVAVSQVDSMVVNMSHQALALDEIFIELEP